MYPEPLKVAVMCEMGPGFQSFTPVGDNQFRMCKHNSSRLLAFYFVNVKLTTSDSGQPRLPTTVPRLRNQD